MEAMSSLGIPLNRSRVLGVAAALAFAAVMAMAQSAGAAGTLWLYPDSEDPSQGGHVVTTGSFVLNLENRGTGGGDTTAYDVFLVLAVDDPQLLTGGTLGLPDGTTVTLDSGALGFGTPVLPCSGRDFPRHGVYPAYFGAFLVGDLAADEVVQIAVDLQGEDGLHAHFDAYGIGYREVAGETRCYDASNPPGHDVEVVLGDGGGTCYELAIEKLASATGVDIGDQVDYVITVENTGTCDLTGVVATEDIPTIGVAIGDLPTPAFTVVAVDPPPTAQNDQEILWELGALVAGDAVELTVTVLFDQPEADGSNVVNTACVTAVEVDEELCSSAVVAVGDAPGDGSIGGPGFWCNQIRFALEGWDNAKFTVEELEGWLLEINQSSLVIVELWDTATL